MGAQSRGPFPPAQLAEGFFKQYYRYARGDGKADLWRRRHAIRYATYLGAMPLLFMLAIRRGPLWLLALVAGALAYCRSPYRRLAPHLPGLGPTERTRAVLLVPVIRVVGDVAKMAGYPAGWIWRLRHWRCREIHWRDPA